MIHLAPFYKNKTPPPGFEPGIPKELDFESNAIPDYAIAAYYVEIEFLLKKLSKRIIH